jgi:uncharacterized protein (DUF58 family)
LKKQFLPLVQFFQKRSYRWFHFKRQGCDIKIELKNWPIVVLFLLLLINFLIYPGQVVMMMLVGTLGVIGCAYLWARQMATRVFVIRRVHYMAFQVGDELEELISIFNQSIFPVLWGEFEDESDLPGYTLSGVRSLGGNDKSDIRLRSLCKRRGVYHLGPWKFLMGDPLGLFRVEYNHPNSEEILVYPPLAPLPPQVLAQRYALGDKRSLRQPVVAETINAFTTRSYLPGDPLRRIHWPTTARRDAPFVRVFDPESSSSIWLVPDFNSANHLGEGDESSLEKMVILTASLADNLLKQKIMVGLAADSEGFRISPARQGKASLWPLLKVLSPIPASHEASLSHALGHLRTLVSSKDLILVLTACFDTQWVSQLKVTGGASLMNRLQVIVLDPNSFGANLPEGALTTWMSQTGIPALLVRKEEIMPVEGTYGTTSRWDFRVTGTGRAVAHHTPKVVEGFQEGA